LIRRGGTDGYTPNFSPGISGGMVGRPHILAVDPLTGLPWNLDDINASEVGLQARA
jgi:hypothetical protein